MMISVWKFAACFGAFHGGLDAHQVHDSAALLQHGLSMLPRAKIHEAAALLQQGAQNQPADFFKEASFGKEVEDFKPLTDGASSAEDFKTFSVMQSETQQHSSVSERESSCQSFLGTWAARNTVSLALVCREAFNDAACVAAEDAFGGDWPQASLGIPPQDVASTACRAVEKKLQSSRSLMFAQQSSNRHTATDLPDWIKAAPVIMEDAERSEWPAPTNEFPATWEGPALTPSGMAAQAAMANNASAGADSATID